MLNRSLPPTTTATSPESPNTYPSSPTYPTSPNQPQFPSSLDSAYQGFSSLVQRALNGIDNFVYGNPYDVGQQPLGQQPAEGQRLQPAPTADAQSPEPGYQIRPDGVPSRVSTLVESPTSGTTVPPGTAAGTSNNARPSSVRPVSALW